jgi:endonuclease/exonuclease/phosphatase family metal-dependent hydrolase
MRVTSWNIQHGELYDRSQNLTFEKILDGIDATGNSDIYAFQEVDCRLARSGNISQPEALAAIAGGAQFGFAAGVIGTPGDGGRNVNDDEKIIVRNGDTTFTGYGNALISRVPVKKWLRKDLGHSPIGMPLSFPIDGKMTTFYCRDENRVAIAAVLENGWTVINTHLSFVPGPNLIQLWNLMRWAHAIEKEYSTKAMIVGDLNLPNGIPQKFSSWHSLREGLTFPQWQPKRQLDYFLARTHHDVKVHAIGVQPFSDHLPVSIEI